MVSTFAEQNHQSGATATGKMEGLSPAIAFEPRGDRPHRRQPKSWIGPMSNCAV
jgi:hypothetical protein